MATLKPCLTISHCQAYLVDVPVRTRVRHGPSAPFPFGVSYGVMTGLKRVFFEIDGLLADGSTIQAFGEASPIYPYSNETPLSVFELLKLYYANHLKGQTISIDDPAAAKCDVSAIISRVEKYLSRERLNFTQAAIDYALHDLTAKAFGLPVYALLSNTPDLSPVRACWSTNSLASIKENVREAEKFNKRGYAIKIKLNGRPDEDARRTSAIIDALPDTGASVRADANAAYSPKSYLIYSKAVSERVGIDEIGRLNFYVEEPIDTRNYGRRALIDLLAVSPFRLMADETLYTLEDASYLVGEAVRAGVVEKLLFNIKVQKVGGLKNAMLVAEIARRHNIPIMIGGMFPSSYGKLANCHYAIAVGRVLDSDGVHPSRDYIDSDRPVIDNLDELECMVDGCRDMTVFQGRPGLGGQIDTDLLKRQSIKVDLDGYYPDFNGFRI